MNINIGIQYIIHIMSILYIIEYLPILYCKYNTVPIIYSIIIIPIMTTIINRYTRTYIHIISTVGILVIHN